MLTEPLNKQADQHNHWESALANSIIGSSWVNVPKPWSEGKVCLVDAEPQLEFVQIDSTPQHAIFLLTDGVTRAEEHEPGSPPHLNGPLFPGDLLLYSPERHAGSHLTRWNQRTQFIAVLLEPSTVSQACNALELDYCEVEFTNHFPTRDPLLEHLVRTLGKEVEAGVTGSGYLYAGQLLQTIAVHLVSKYTAGEPTARVYQGGMPNFRLRRIEDYVRTHLAEEIGIEDLANEVGLSRWHFSRTFEQATGEAPSRYVQRLRMEQAIYLLQTTDLPITEVAYAVGYTSLSHFTKLFKHRFGTTPGTYQRCRSR